MIDPAPYRRIQELEDKIAELKEMFGLTENPRWAALGFTVYEGRILEALMKARILSKDGMLYALYAGGAEAYERDPKITDVYVCHINRKLQPYGVKILTVWGRGRCLSAASKAILSAL